MLLQMRLKFDLAMLISHSSSSFTAKALCPGPAWGHHTFSGSDAELRSKPCVEHDATAGDCLMPSASIQQV